MKKSTLILVVVAVCIVTSGLTTLAVTKILQNKTFPTAAARDAGFGTGGTGTHYAAWSRDGFPDLTYAAENAVQAVVNIESISEVRVAGGGGYNPLYEFFGIPESSRQPQERTRERRAGGSGVIVSADGFIVTNNHVIENAKRLRVKLYDGLMFDATLIGTDPSTDIALIKIEAQNLPTIPFGNSDELRLGEWVLAIGSPFDLQSTITAGIVSAKGRSLHTTGDKMDIQSFIQTDAVVNMGNSGGALVNTRGQLVGINTALTSPTGTYIGYSFAVPVSIVQKVISDLKEYGVVQRAVIGVRFSEIDAKFFEQFGEELGIKEPSGLYVAEVIPGGGAEAAGMKEGDIITEVDGLKMTSSSMLLEYIAKKRPNDRVNITVKREGNVKHFEVVLRNMAGKAELLDKDTVFAVDALGGTFGELSEREVKELKIEGGVVVKSVEPNGLLNRSKITRGFVITAINDKPVRSLEDLRKSTDKIVSIGGLYPGREHRTYVIVE